MPGSRIGGAAVLLSAQLAACAPSTEGLVSPGPDAAPDDARTASGAPDFALMPVTLPRGPTEPPRLDPNRTYALPELIDIAQRANPATAAAWERARDAAMSVGEVEATYLPQISANVLLGYGQTSQFEPAVPELGIPAGRLVATGAQAAPNLAMQWLLFDFGGRSAARQVASEAASGALVGFQAAHQQVIFEVTNAYFQLAAARSEIGLNRQQVADASALRAVAEDRLDEGIGTSVEVAQARQIEAQARFDLTLAEGRERDDYARLLRAMGLPLTTRLRVADLSGRRLPRQVPQQLDQLIEVSLARRADVQAALAELRASNAEIALVEAQRLPKVVLTGEVGGVTGNFTLDDSRIPGEASLDDNLPEATAGVLISVPIFDGGLRETQRARARARAAAAARDLESIESAAALEIVEAYNLLQTSLAAYAASGSLVDSAEVTYADTLGLYENGLVSLAEVSATNAGLATARLVRTNAFSDAFSAATALAFATGALTSSDAPSRF